MNPAWKRFFSPRRNEQERDPVMADHLERQVNENIRRGMSPDEARRSARLSLGGVEQVKEECRDERPARLISDLARDIRHSVRALRRRPGFTMVAVLTMALGIGANTAVFSVVYGVLIRPLPFTNGDRLVVIRQAATKAKITDMSFSVKEIIDYRTQSHTLDQVVEHHSMSFLLLGGDEPFRVSTGVVSPNYFDVLGVKPVMGRTFVEDDDKPEGQAVLVLTNAFWKEHLGGDPNVIGRVFRMNDKEHTVIGVLSPIPQYPAKNDIYMPTSHCPFRSNQMHRESRDMRMMDVFGRLKPGVTEAEARADLALVASHLEQTYPESYPAKFGYTATVASLRDELSADAKSNVMPLLAASVFVLLIACASVANLLLARVMRQERELAIRAALGASRGRLTRQLLTESLLLSLAGGALGLAIAPFALDLLTKLAAGFSPRFGEIRIDLPVLLFTLGISLATGVLFGLAPAFSFKGDINDAMKEGGKSTDTRGRQSVRKALVVAQLAFSFVLLAGAGLALRSLWKLLTVNPGYRSDKVLVLRLDPSFTRYQKDDEYQRLSRNILEKAKALPGVRSVSLSSTYPLNPRQITAKDTTNTDFRIEGQQVDPRKVASRTRVMIASPEYFDTIGLPLIRGRWFTAPEERESLGVAVINESMARHHWQDMSPSSDPIGRRVSFDKGEHWLTVTGIVGDMKEFGLDRSAADEMYVPLKQSGFAPSLLIRTSSDPKSLMKMATLAVHEAGQDVAVYDTGTLDQARENATASPRLTALLLSLFAALALIITAVGLGGVLALAVSQRRQELGIRMALGATHASVVMMVLRQGLTMAGLGIAIGLPASMALTRLVSAVLYDTRPNDVLTMTGVSVLLVTVAAIACFVPARQATRIDPLIALRAE